MSNTNEDIVLKDIALFAAEGTLYDGTLSLEVCKTVAEAEGILDQEAKEMLEEFLQFGLGAQLTLKSLDVAARLLKGVRSEAAQEVSVAFFKGRDLYGYVKPAMDQLSEAQIIVVTGELDVVAHGLCAKLGLLENRGNGNGDQPYYGSLLSNEDGIYKGSVSLAVGYLTMRDLAEQLFSNRQRITRLPKRAANESSVERRKKVHDPGRKSIAVGHYDQHLGMLQSAQRAIAILPPQDLTETPHAKELIKTTDPSHPIPKLSFDF